MINYLRPPRDSYNGLSGGHQNNIYFFFYLSKTKATDMLSDWSWWQIPGVSDEIFL